MRDTSPQTHYNQRMSREYVPPPRQPQNRKDDFNERLEDLRDFEDGVYASVEMGYQPTAVQLARAATLKRHNRIYYFIPIVLLLVIVALTGIALLALAFWPADLDGNRVVISGVADLVVLTTAIMLTPLCLILPIGALALYFYDRGREYSRIEAFQRLLWRVDNKAETVRDYTAVYSEKTAKPIILFNSYLVAIRNSLIRLKQLLFGGK